MANIIPVRITSRKRIISYSNRHGSHNRQLVSISKQGPPVCKITPKCLVINARSIAKPDAASALIAELSTNDVDICIIPIRGSRRKFSLADLPQWLYLCEKRS